MAQQMRHDGARKARSPGHLDEFLLAPWLPWHPSPSSSMQFAALMKLLGERNWWAPRPLARLHARLRLSET